MKPSSERLGTTRRLSALRADLTSTKRLLLDDLWKQFQMTSQWPLLRSFYSQHGKAKVREAFSALGGDVVWEERDRSQNVCKLKLPGILLTSEGPALEKLLQRYFEFQCQLFKKNPEKQQISSAEIRSLLGLTESETSSLFELIWVGGLFGVTGTKANGEWTVTPMKEAEDFADRGDMGE